MRVEEKEKDILYKEKDKEGKKEREQEKREWRGQPLKCHEAPREITKMKDEVLRGCYH